MGPCIRRVDKSLLHMRDCDNYLISLARSCKVEYHTKNAGVISDGRQSPAGLNAHLTSQNYTVNQQCHLISG